MRFRYPDGKKLSPVQALEFTISKWQDGKRYEWALQRQMVDDGLPNGGAAPNWRMWTGSAWSNTPIRQQMRPDVWHAIRLDGAIVGGKTVHTSMSCDDVGGSLRACAFAPMPTTFADFVSVAMQLNTRDGRGWMDIADVQLLMA